MTTRAIPNRALRAAAALLLVAALASGCNRPAPRAVESPGEPENPVLLVTAAKAEVRPMTSELRLLGRTIAMRHIIIRAPTAGRVVEMKLSSGEMVRKGQVVARVINREIEAAEAGLAVMRQLDPQDASSLSQSVARHRGGAGIAVVAPETGVVSQPPVTSGQMVADLDTLVDLIDLASLYVEVSVPLSQLHLMRPGMVATVTTPLRPGVEIPARVAAVMPNFDASSASSPLKLEFTGKDRIAEAGAPVEARITTASVPDAIAIPTSALFQDAGTERFHVFVISQDGRAHRTDVTLGVRGHGLVQVSAGVKPGEMVATSGGYALSDGLSVRIAGAHP